MILSLVNVKGGVGKTTTAVNLSATFARTGLRVLLVDLDPQGSASFSLGVGMDEASPSSADVLLDNVPIQEAIRPSDTPDLDLLTGAMALAGADIALARKKAPHGLLARALGSVRRSYDAIVIDCPPGLSILTVNGIAASTAYVVPVVPHDLDMEALAHLFEGLHAVEERVGPLPDLLGILLTMVDHRTRVTDQWVTAIRKGYGKGVFRTEIPINVRLSEAPGYGLTIFDYESWSKGAQAYAKLGAEILRRSRKAGLL